MAKGGDNMTTGEKIRQARKALKLNQTQAAKLIDINQSRWSAIETEKYGLSVKVLRRVAEALGVQPGNLL